MEQEYTPNYNNNTTPIWNSIFAARCSSELELLFFCLKKKIAWNITISHTQILK